MSIENCKELDLELWLLTAVWLNTWLFKVQNYANSILIVVSNQAVMCIGTIGYHVRSQGLLRHFCFFNYWSHRYEAKIVSDDFWVKFTPHRR